MIGRARAVLGALALGAAVAACEPRGPGSLNATVEAPGPTGAVVIELAGQRMTSFEGVGGTRTFATQGSPADTLRRVVVVSPAGVELRFRIAVEDIGADPPRAAVVDAVDPSNLKVPTLTGYRVKISR